jgi:hypothetical protein
VFYVPDTAFGGNWRVVQKFQHRHLWSVTETDAENHPGGSGLTYRDEDSMEDPMQAKEADVQTRLRRDRKRVLLDAAVVEKFKKRRAEVAGHDNEDDEQNMADPTMTQYCSDNEENGTARPVPCFNIEDDEY